MRLVKTLPYEQIEWRNSTECMNTCRQYNLISQHSQEKWLKNIEDDPTIEMYGISTIVSSPKGPYAAEKIIGTCGFTSIDKNHGKAEWSLLIGKPYQGKGYGRKALELLVDFGFDNWPWLNRIWGEIFEGNDASFKIAEHNAFTTEAYLRETYFKNGNYIDSSIVRLLREEWEFCKQTERTVVR